ncbi:hypothetical protein Efla_002309 [Eimeria flavescens]
MASSDASAQEGEARAGGPLVVDEGAVAASLSALNSTLREALSELSRHVDLVAASAATKGRVHDSVDGGPPSAGGPQATPDAAGARGPSYKLPPQQQSPSGPTMKEARRLAQHLLYKLMPYDPTYHVLIKFYGVPTTPNRLTRALPASINRLWLTILLRSFPSTYARRPLRQTVVAAGPSQRPEVKRVKRRKKAMHEEAAGWFVSTHRVTMLGFCYSEQAQPANPCSGHIAAGLDNATVQSLRSVLLENEALANFRLSGLGDLSRLAVIGRENELSAQRVVRLLLAEPSLLFKDHNTMAAVLMVVPQYPWGAPAGSRGGPPEDGWSQLQPRLTDGFFPLYSKSISGVDAPKEVLTCPCEARGPPAGSAVAGGPEEAAASSAAGLSAACSEQEAADPNVHLLIEMSGEGPGLDIRSFPRQIVQLISAEEGDSQPINYYHHQEDYSLNDSIILNSSTAEMPFPTRKFIDESRIILQGTCRRVVSATGTSTLLKTREFGVHLSQHQRRSVEMQLPESRILVHIEILGIPGGPQRPAEADSSLAHFAGPQFLSEHREKEPCSAVDAAILIRQRIADQFRHVWGNARVVLWEIDDNKQETDTKARLLPPARASSGAIQEEGQPGKSDYQTWKILVAVLVPSFVVGALVVASWHSTSICKCGASGPNSTDTDTSVASPPAQTRASNKEKPAAEAEGT